MSYKDIAECVLVCTCTHLLMVYIISNTWNNNYFCRIFTGGNIFQSCFICSCRNWMLFPCFHTKWIILAFGWSPCVFTDQLMVPTMHLCCTGSQRHYDQRMGCVSLSCFDFNPGLDWYFHCSCFYCSKNTFTKMRK